MAHIMVFIHFASFGVGIVFLTLGIFLYLKNKGTLLKYALFMDMFYTLMLSFDSIDLYIRKNIPVYPVWVHPSMRIGIYITGTGFIYFILLSVRHMIKRDIHKDAKAIIYMVSTIVVLGMTAMTITGLTDSLPNFLYKIPYSPLIYLMLNIIGLYCLKKYFSQTSKEASMKEVEAAKFDIKEYTNKCGITERELEIIQLIVNGHSNKEIGEKLFVSPNTVKNHVYSLYRKLGIKTRYELISLISSKGREM